MKKKKILFGTLLTDYHLFGYQWAKKGQTVEITDENPASNPVEVSISLYSHEDRDEYTFFVDLDDIEIIEDDE